MAEHVRRDPEQRRPRVALRIEPPDASDRLSTSRQEGYRALQAADGDTARELLEREEPSIVVLDLMLPGTDVLASSMNVRATASLSEAHGRRLPTG